MTIPVAKSVKFIDLDYLRDKVNILWAIAYQEYQLNPDIIFLNLDEQVEQKEKNKEFAANDDNWEQVRKDLETYDSITKQHACMLFAGDFINNPSQQVQRLVKKMMIASEEWDVGYLSHEGERFRCYVRKDAGKKGSKKRLPFTHLLGDSNQDF